MRNIFIFSLLFLIIGCKKEGLNVKFKTIYTSGQNTKKAGKVYTAVNGDYTRFGDFVGTITPKKVNARFNSIRYIDRKKTLEGTQTMVELISTNWPEEDTRRFADFTNGGTIEVIPEMWGNIDNDGWFADENIRLSYLGIFPAYFNFEFDLPAQFTNVPINQNYPVPNTILREGNSLKCKLNYFLYNMGNAYDLRGFVFGGTDTSYIVKQSGIPAWDITELISMAQPGDVARSGNYTCPVLTPPAKGESKLIKTTISFHSDNLIQHYAGHDNVPYTNDDIFVFPTKFWERFNIVIDQN